MTVRPLLVLLLLGGAVPAHACPMADAMASYLHEALPALVAGQVAAEVEIIGRSSARGSAGDGEFAMDARLVRMLRGDYSGSLVRLDPQRVTSCDDFPEPGERGILVGRVVSSSPDLLVVVPVLAPSTRASRLRVDAAPSR